jgi:RimJ/RimL family protein N-acetyltransferase
MTRQIGVDEARAFFADRTQQVASMITPDQLPADGVEYWADEGVCGAFHLAPWPGVWMAHYGVKPSQWGKTIPPARRILYAFWKAKQPDRIVGWTLESNRAAISFARRLGFVVDGRLDLKEPVIMQGWSV